MEIAGKRPPLVRPRVVRHSSPLLNLAHFEQRMFPSGHWTYDEPITELVFSQLLNETIQRLDIHQAAQEVEPFVKDRRAIELWSREFFIEISKRIEPV